MGTHAGDGAGYARRRLRAPAKVSGQAQNTLKSKTERVAELKGPLNAAIAAWGGGTQKEGVQAFQKRILDAIQDDDDDRRRRRRRRRRRQASGLSERRWELPMHVAVEPHLEHHSTTPHPQGGTHRGRGPMPLAW